MPPKPKITKPMLLNTVLEITRKAGFEAVNARNIAQMLNCSTRPIFTCFENMEELKTEFLDFAFSFYEQYVTAYSKSQPTDPCLILPLSYIAFAREETHLFRLLFINDMDLSMKETKDFFKEIGNEKKAKAFSDGIGLKFEQGKPIFLDLFLYSHGIAVLTAAGKVTLDKDTLTFMLQNLLSALINQAKENMSPT